MDTGELIKGGLFLGVVLAMAIVGRYVQAERPGPADGTEGNAQPQARDRGDKARGRTRSSLR